MSRLTHRLDKRRWERVRRAAFERDGWRCTRCKRPGRLEAHHVKELRDGGAAYDLANVKTLCRACHVALHRPKLSAERQAWRDVLSEIGARGPI